MATNKLAIVIDRDIEMELIRTVMVALQIYLDDETSVSNKTTLKESLASYEKTLDAAAKAADEKTTDGG